MVRSVTKKYQVWLAGYYDDFNGARAIPDDKNLPSDASYDGVGNTHYGNPMNGEATLNPRYRWSWIDRKRTTGGKYISTTDNQYLRNDGSYEWLSFDDTQQTPSEWEGRAQLQYPDGHTPNRFIYSTVGSDGYVRFVNGYDTLGQYLIGTGDGDATFGRADMEEMDETNYESGLAFTLSLTETFMQRAHLAGVWMGEGIDTSDYTNTTPTHVFGEVTSPAGKPFLCVQAARKNQTIEVNKPSLLYDGPLNTRLDGDTFTVRLAARSFNASGAVASSIKFRVGFPDSESGVTNSDGYTGTPLIDYTYALSSYDTLGLLYNGATLDNSYSNDDNWIDFDFVMNHTAGTFDVYVNGTSHEASVSMQVGRPATANAYGYELILYPTATAEGITSTLMIDRVGLVRYLTDNPSSSEEATIQNANIRYSVNGISSCTIKFADDPDLHGDGYRGTSLTNYIQNLKDIFVSTDPLDWKLLFFGDTSVRIDRPLWRGIVENFTINQAGRSREIILKCRDMLSLMDRQIPIWEVGQKSIKDESEDSIPYWLHEAKGYQDIMYMGSRKLKLLNEDVGFDLQNSFKESSTQRMQLGSGHPIQMYNNENLLSDEGNIVNIGPNSIEEQYEGLGILGFQGNNTTTRVMMVRNHGISTGTITIINCNITSNNIDSKTPSSYSSSSNYFEFSNANLSYTPEDSKIIYMGKYEGMDYASPIFNSPSSNDTSNDKLNIFFDSDPELNIGDEFLVNRWDDDNNSINSRYSEKRHRVASIKQFQSYFDGIETVTGNPITVYAVQTHTEYISGSESAYGDYEGDDLLIHDDVISWSRDIGQVKVVTTSHRAIHAKWMRDMPKSLWFRYHFGKIGNKPVHKTWPEHNTHTDTYNILSNIGSVTQVNSGELTGYNLAALPIALSVKEFTMVSGGVAEYNKLPSAGVGEIWVRDGTTYTFFDNFIYRGKEHDTSSTYHKTILKGVSMRTKIMPALTTGTDYIFRIRDISDDYKHLWILWSDMRNNGEADADGGTRKQDFGLQYPTSQNYDCSLYYIDQFDSEGNIDKFGSLNIGEDIDIWNIDATNDPSTSGAFSKPADYDNQYDITLVNQGGKLKINTGTTTGVQDKDYIHIINSISHDGIHEVTSVSSGVSITTDTAFISNTESTNGATYCKSIGSESDFSCYHDWEDKAGAFIIIDSSKFFNLNTNINGGKTGQSAGGNSDLGDYVATSHGFPALIDNYWVEAASTYKTTKNTFDPHPSQYRLISDATLADEGLFIGDMGLPVEDASIFDDWGLGRIIIKFDNNNNADSQAEYFFWWFGKLEEAVEVTSVTAQAYIPTEIDNNSDGTIDEDEYITVGGSKTITSFSTITKSGETFETKGLLPYQTIKNTTTGEREFIYEVVSETVLRVSGTWTTGDNFVVPVQLAGVKMTPVTKELAALALQDDSGQWGGFSLEEEVAQRLINELGDTSTLSGWGINLHQPLYSDTEENASSIEVHTTLTSQYMLRLMMHLEGTAKSKNSGSFYDSDKIRTLWNASIMDTWLPRTRLSAMYDINNVPITSMMTTYNDTSSNDDYGSVLKSHNKTLHSIIESIRGVSGVGTINGLNTTFSYLSGRDGRLDFRPKYNSGLAFTRSNMKVSSFNNKLSGQITNVRVYYSSGKSFIDYPGTNMSDTTRWKILEYPKISQQIEAEVVAKNEYNKSKESKMSISLEPMLESDVENKMIESGRYGYIADPQIALKGTDLENNSTDGHKYVTNWTRLGTGGVLFPGMVNALDGNQGEGTTFSRYGNSKDIDVTSSNIAWDDNYYWYGSGSVSYAVQVVHIPNKTPLLSTTSGEAMRISVDLKSGQDGADIDNAEFTVTLTDYSFSGRTRAAESRGTSSKNVKHSGFYEIDIPTSYGAVANATIVFSFNAEYCRALLRHRCGDPTDTSLLDITDATLRGRSIFPLGLKEYTWVSGFKSARKIWYAPRINIVKDISYIPATYASVTDAGLGLSSATNLVIQTINWDMSAGKMETVSLNLERDESLMGNGLMSYLFPQNGQGLQQGGGGGSDSSVDNTDNNDYIPPEIYPDVDGTDREWEKPDWGLVDGKPQGGNDAVNRQSTTKLNDLDSNAYGKIKGRMDLINDNMSAGATFSILGQQRPASTPTSLRPINSEIQVTGGSSALTSQGYIFAGKGIQQEQQSIGKIGSIEIRFTVPNDVVSDQIQISSKVTHGTATNLKTAILVTTVTVESTGESITYNKHIKSGVREVEMHLIPLQKLVGIKNSGEKILVTIERKAGVGRDNSDNNSVVLHDPKIYLQRASAPTKSSSSQFSLI